MVDLTPWKKVKARFESGGRVSLAVREMAEEVLGEKFVRRAGPAGGAPARPDFRDREAGDDSFDDDQGHDGGMVVL